MTQQPTNTVLENNIPHNPFSGPEILRVINTTQPQEELWTACKLGGDNANRAYNESVCLDFKGELNKIAIEKAIKTLVDRHESLKCVFSTNGEYVTIFREIEVPVNFVDISLNSEKEQQTALNKYVNDDAEYIFDLVKGPLIKFTLIKISNFEHRLIITSHHIICDGWSMGIMLQELGTLYSAYATDTLPKIPESENFSSYSDELLELVESDAYQNIETFWLKQYEDSVPEVSLPTDSPYPALRTYKSNRLDFPLNKDLLNQIKTLGLKSNCGIVTTLLAAFDIFLFKTTNQSDVVVGLPAAGQSATGMTQLVGHCVNLLPLRTKLNTQLSFKDYLKQKNNNLYDAYDHQQLSFGHLLQKLTIPRDPSRVPLVPVVFNIDLGMDQGVAFHDLTYKLISNPRQYEIFDIFLNASGSENDLVFEWSYNETIFKPETIEKMMSSFETIIENLVASPDEPLAEIVYDNFKKSYTELNQTQTSYPNDSLFELFKKRAALNPKKIAIESDDEQITYEDVLKKVNQLARYLNNKGIGEGDFVGVGLSRNPDLVVSLLAILQCGAAYQPLDPEYPKNRLEFMLDDSKAKILITSKNHSDSFPDTATKILLEEAVISSKQLEEKPLPIKVPNTNLAYILYTSGSTGKPKGVKVTHKNLVNFLTSMAVEPGIDKKDRLLSITTISFDIAGLELFLPLLEGATLVLSDENTAKDGRLLLNVLREKNISILQATPTTWKMLLDLGWKDPLPLKALCGGEALPLSLAKQLLTKCDSLWNMYGPTETTIWSAVKEIHREDEFITIGKPIANTQLYIVGENNKLMPPGTVGEIGIGGDGVSQGYWNRPVLTNEKFIPNPFDNTSQSTLYFTGDLGKVLPSGEVQCLGRTDQQVKIRGHRIELGDIEQALLTLDGVKDAVVSVNSERLIAHIVKDVESSYDDNAVVLWKDRLKEELPSHLVPYEFKFLSELPKTLNGKIDRKALTINEEPKAKIKLHTSPRTKAEQLVAEIWQDCLEIDNIDIFSDFFELGGHSLIAVKVMALIEERTGKQLPLSALLEYSTIEKFALLLDMDNHFITWDSLVPIKREGNKTPLYIVHGAGMNVLIFNALAKNLDNDQPVYGLQAKGLNGIDEPYGTVEEIAAHYVEAITKGNTKGPYALAGYSFGGIIAYEMANQMLNLNKKVTMLAMLDTYAHPSYYYKSSIRKKIAFFNYKFKSNMFVIKQMISSSKHLKERVNTQLKNIENFYLSIKNGKSKQHEIIYNQPYLLDKMNEIASNKYHLVPKNIKIDLFRVEDATYYMHDNEYLGWKEIALNGVDIHEIPGDHNELFSPPNDRKSAMILQDILDQRHYSI
ncbi:amino acid adenylation domain-containing protein [Flavobacteriaceae bacterium MHTCC 0001]